MFKSYELHVTQVFRYYKIMLNSNVPIYCPEYDEDKRVLSKYDNTIFKLFFFSLNLRFHLKLPKIF